MTKRFAHGLLAATALMIATTVPASATHTAGGPHPTFRAENAYFHCAGGSKVQNQSSTGSTPWDTTAPTASVTTGAGCVATDPNLVAAAGTAQANLYDFVTTGAFTGNMKSMTVKLHNLVAGKVRPGATLQLRVRLDIDGEQLFTTTTTAKTVTVTPKAGATPATEYIEFSIVNLGFANYEYDEAGNLLDVTTGGLANEEGDGATEHTVILSVDTLSAPTQGLWALDTTETPSGITFNPDTIASAKITSPLPQGTEG